MPPQGPPLSGPGPDAPADSGAAHGVRPVLAVRRRERFLVGLATAIAVFVLLGVGAILGVRAQAKKIRPIEQIETPEEFEVQERRTHRLTRDQLLSGMADVGTVGMIHFDGPPPRVVRNPLDPMAKQPISVPAYVFLPRTAPGDRSLPLVVYVHGGVHGQVAGSDLVVLHDLVAQGCAVIAPDYRGSAGYGRAYRELVDYGGLEIDDVRAARLWLLEHEPRIDPDRVGLLGFSHGGAIAMMCLARFPGEFRAGVAGVPVCDLTRRLRYKDQDYRDLFSAPYHVGRTLDEAPDEYLRRSAVSCIDSLRNPLLIHATTNDEDVQVDEIVAFVKLLREAGHAPAFRLFRDAPGGHVFTHGESPEGRESRAEIYRFLAEHLALPIPFDPPPEAKSPRPSLKRMRRRRRAPLPLA